MGKREDDRAVRGRPAAARGLRRDRAALEGAADPPRHLPPALAQRQQRRDAARRVRPVRDVLLRVALPAGDPRLQAARGRVRVPALHARDRDRRGRVAGADPEDRHPSRQLHRHHDGRVGSSTSAGCPSTGATCASPAHDSRGLDRHGHDVRPAHPARDDERRLGGCGTRVGALQHVAAGRRRARPGDPVDARGIPHEPPVQRGPQTPAARVDAARAATTSPSRSAR